MKTLILLIISIGWEIRLSYSTVQDIRKIIDPRIELKLISLQNAFSACCDIKFQEDNHTCKTSFKNTLESNEFIKLIILTATQEEFGSLLNELLDGSKKHVWEAKYTETIKTVPNLNRASIDNFSKGVQHAIKEYNTITADFKKVCEDHNSFVEKYNTIIDATNYGIIMGGSLLRYTNDFNTFIDKLLQEVQTKEKLNTILISSFLWQKYFIVGNITNIVDELRDNVITRDDVEKIENLLKEPSWCIKLMTCSFKDLVQVARNYDSKLEIEEQSENFKTPYENCLNLNGNFRYVIDTLQNIYEKNQMDKLGKGSGEQGKGEQGGTEGDGDEDDDDYD